ncbi:hypothetical protein BOTCAL_0646g00040 [Botryotinia calthae]|uniref:Phospholipid/glycerol acyltransferase domain-containing protein n=1 Tax=Botryotinia calthae TaxID=38488 RepID=A0A4Y8CJR4_9HELO|nr:hypothetical protein BOTCAL_0646g00040 [Botryotinia calthae]
MADQNLKQRNKPPTMPAPVPDFGGGTKEKALEEGGHPSGEVRHGSVAQIGRLLSFATYFWACCSTIQATQLIGVPLYWINRNIYYSWMALTKQSFGLLITTMTQWWSPTVVRISGDASVAGQLRKTADGRAECDFPERLIMIANHQLYTDWLYLWWVAYTNQPQTHGYIYIIAKDSLKWVPIIGWGMQFFNFIFMSRKMEKDRPVMAHRFKQLQEKRPGASELDPMWLLLFPEGTNASDNRREARAKWAAKIGVKDMEHTLLPRSTGSFFCLNELKKTVDYVYDCTMAYEGVPRGKFGQDYFTLTSSYIEGRPPKSVNLFWRRFKIADIPLDNPEKFEVWLRERWYEKDALMEQYMTTGRFPANVPSEKGTVEDFIETEVRPKHWWEVFDIFTVLATTGFIANLLAKVWNVVFYGITRR